MKYSSIALIFAFTSSALAAVRQVQLFAESDNDEISGQGLSSIHEGAGTNYFFLGEAGQTLQYDDEARSLYITLNSQPPAPQQLAFQGQFLALTVAQGALSVDIQEDGSVSFDGSDSLYAAKNVDDPYRYSENSWAVVNTESDGAIPLRIQARFVGENEETSSSTEEPVSTEEPTEEPTGEPTPAPVDNSTTPETTISTFEAAGVKVSGGLSIAAVAFAALGLAF